MKSLINKLEKDGARAICKHTLLGSLLRKESGHAFVELALMLPLFSMIIIGAAEFSQLTYAFNEVSNAAHAGVQFGAQNHVTARDTSAMQLAATNDGLNVTNLKATATNFCVCSNGAAITCANAATACSARTILYVQVNTSVLMDPLFYLPGLPKTYTLHAQATMRAEQ